MCKFLCSKGVFWGVFADLVETSVSSRGRYDAEFGSPTWTRTRDKRINRSQMYRYRAVS